MIIKIPREVIKDLSTLDKYNIWFEISEKQVRISFTTNIGSLSGDREDVPIDDIDNIGVYFERIVKRMIKMEEFIKSERKRMYGR